MQREYDFYPPFPALKGSSTWPLAGALATWYGDALLLRPLPADWHLWLATEFIVSVAGTQVGADYSSHCCVYTVRAGGGGGAKGSVGLGGLGGGVLGRHSWARACMGVHAHVHGCALEGAGCEWRNSSTMHYACALVACAFAGNAPPAGRFRPRARTALHWARAPTPRHNLARELRKCILWVYLMAMMHSPRLNSRAQET